MLKFFRRLRNQQGMSLIEILIVLGIIAASMAAILNTVFSSGDKAKVKQAETEIEKMGGFVKLYKQDNGKYPTNDQGLEALVEAGYMESVPQDPWKNDFTYECQSQYCPTQENCPDRRQSIGKPDDRMAHRILVGRTHPPVLGIHRTRL